RVTPRNSSTRSRFVATLIVLLLVLPSAHSQQPPQPRNADLDRVRGDIGRLRKQLDALRQQAQSTERELGEVDLELDIRTRELELATKMAAQIEQQRQGVAAQIAAIGPRIESQKADLRKRLVALYRLGGLSYLRMLLELDDEQNPIEAVSMLSYLVSRDARAMTTFQATRQQLAQRHVELAVRQKELVQTRRVVEDRRRAVIAAHAQKEQLLAKLRVEESGSQKQLVALEEKARRLERLVALLAQQNRATNMPVLDIRSVQGALAWPVTGKIIERFGRQRNPKFSTFTVNNGVTIQAAPGTPVRAVFQGTVLFSQWFKGYGNLIILDHGNRVFTLYGNLKASSVAVGDRIAGGQPIARVAESVAESEDVSSGHLYFEIRQDNRPEDPQKWLR
ncbi:MAG: murein hydrolase activator, partial [Acidobacteriota bacterium]|nr:murein hydrolase activator [Acidobacteriota bacterium]